MKYSKKETLQLFTIAYVEFNGRELTGEETKRVFGEISAKSGHTPEELYNILREESKTQFN